MGQGQGQGQAWHLHHLPYPQLPRHSTQLLTVLSAWPLLFSGPHLALEGDELGVKASKSEVGKVRAS